jgi:hypothetical protein
MQLRVGMGRVAMRQSDGGRCVFCIIRSIIILVPACLWCSLYVAVMLYNCIERVCGCSQA